MIRSENKLGHYLILMRPRWKTLSSPMFYYLKILKWELLLVFSFIFSMLTEDLAWFFIIMALICNNTVFNISVLLVFAPKSFIILLVSDLFPWSFIVGDCFTEFIDYILFFEFINRSVRFLNIFLLIRSSIHIVADQPFGSSIFVFVLVVDLLICFEADKIDISLINLLMLVLVDGILLFWGFGFELIGSIAEIFIKIAATIR